jgi:serine/threonine protein kinase
MSTARSQVPYFTDSSMQRYVYNPDLITALLKDFRFMKSTLASASAPSLPEYSFEEIGRGAFAVAYKVTNAATGQPVYVLKHILKSNFDMDRNEVNVLVGLKMNPTTSPYVTQIEAANLNKAANTANIIIMKYEKGMTLDKYIESAGTGEPKRLSGPVASSIKEELRAGIKAIHRTGLIHADIKPSNIYVVLNEDGSYKKTIYIDFGLSVKEGTVSGYRGTPKFATRDLRAVFNAGRRGEKKTHMYIRDDNMWPLSLTYRAIDGEKEYQIGGRRSRTRSRGRSRSRSAQPRSRSAQPRSGSAKLRHHSRRVTLRNKKKT